MRSSGLEARKRGPGIFLAIAAACAFGLTARPAHSQSGSATNSSLAATEKSSRQPSAAEQPVTSSEAASDPATPALCPVVYPDDATPASRGYRYTFFGNAFFINDQGYLLTVAHVVDTFHDGGQPYILVSRPNAPPQLIGVTVVAKDPQHDVAILRATPNPFGAKYEVAFVALNSEAAVRGEAVLALSLHPKKAQDAHSFEYQREDSSAGTVVAIESTQLQKPGPPSEVFLLSHPVVKGQSGSPVLALNSRGVVGLVEGLWLRGVSLSSNKASALPTDAPGAAVPIRYAIALLDQNHVAWTAPGKKSAPPVMPSGSGHPH